MGIQKKSRMVKRHNYHLFLDLIKILKYFIQQNIGIKEET